MAAPQNPAPYVMPAPPAIVAWRNAPNVAPSYAIVTAAGRNAINLFLVPPDSRGGIPKDAVRHVSDPWNISHGIDPVAGVWDYTDESKLLQELSAALTK